MNCTHAKGHATLRQNFEKMYNLMRLDGYFDQILYYNCFFLKCSLCIEQWYMISREKMGYILCTSQYKLSKDMYIPLTYSHLIYI